MRISSTVLMAVLFSGTAGAQAFQFRAPAPELSAATAAWQISSEPILVQGLVYLPTRDYRLPSPLAFSTARAALRRFGIP